MLAGVVAFMPGGVVADEEDTLSGFDGGMGIFHQHRAGDCGSLADVDVGGAVFEHDGGEAVAFGDGEGAVHVDLDDDAAGEEEADAAGVVGGDAFIVSEEGLQFATARAGGSGDGCVAERGGDSADAAMFILLYRLGMYERGSG